MLRNLMLNGESIMTPTLLDKQTLQLINQKNLKYSLVAAEKDYFWVSWNCRGTRQIWGCQRRIGGVK